MSTEPSQEKTPSVEWTFTGAPEPVNVACVPAAVASDDVLVIELPASNTFGTAENRKRSANRQSNLAPNWPPKRLLLVAALKSSGLPEMPEEVLRVSTSSSWKNRNPASHMRFTLRLAA